MPQEGVAGVRATVPRGDLEGELPVRDDRGADARVKGIFARRRRGGASRLGRHPRIGRRSRRRPLPRGIGGAAVGCGKSRPGGVGAKQLGGGAERGALVNAHIIRDGQVEGGGSVGRVGGGRSTNTSANSPAGAVATAHSRGSSSRGRRGRRHASAGRGGRPTPSRAAETRTHQCRSLGQWRSGHVQQTPERPNRITAATTAAVALPSAPGGQPDRHALVAKPGVSVQGGPPGVSGQRRCDGAREVRGVCPRYRHQVRWWSGQLLNTPPPTSVTPAGSAISGRRRRRSGQCGRRRLGGIDRRRQRLVQEVIKRITGGTRRSYPSHSCRRGGGGHVLLICHPAEAMRWERAHIGTGASVKCDGRAHSSQP